MAMAVYSRQQWGARPAERSSPQVWGMTGFAVHHLGTDNLIAPTTVEGAMAMLRAVQAGHLNHPTEDYSDIAYNVAVDQLGNRYVLRGLDRMGGATYGANDHVIACLWIGDSRYVAPTTAALQAIAAWYQEGVATGVLVNGCAIGGHGDWTPGTSCPGPALKAQLPTIRALAGGATIDPTAPLIDGDDDVLTPEQTAQLKAAADVLAPHWNRINRAATLADVAEAIYVNFTTTHQTNQEIIALLRSIDRRLAAGVPSSGGASAAAVVDEVARRLSN